MKNLKLLMKRLFCKALVMCRFWHYEITYRHCGNCGEMWHEYKWLHKTRGKTKVNHITEACCYEL